MIKVNAHGGELHINGPIDDILAEYAILTRTIVKQLEDMTNKDTAFETLAKLGQIAVKDYEKDMDPQKIYDTVTEVVDDVIEI